MTIFVPLKHTFHGKLVNGINGPFTGTIGTIVGSSRYGEHYVKAKYKKRTKDITAVAKTR